MSREKQNSGCCENCNSQEEKQIEEIAKILCGMKNGCVGCMFSKSNCFERKDAEAIYNADFRKQEWISVDERLPEESGWCLVYIITPFDLEFVSISHYSKGYGWNNPDTITHWMPLPEAPKMKGGAE